jgi:HAD superfamily hydrolase (TIGR01459 family)
MSLPQPVPLLHSISILAPSYDAWICDIWGVLHNGVRAFEAAGKACCSFRREGGTILLLSNAPRPAAEVQRQLDRLGVSREAYDGILTSGDLTRRLIVDHPVQRILHVGPDRDRPIFAGLEVQFADEETAGLIVCSGLVDDERETPLDYVPMFERLIARRIPMICANPDLKVERGERLIYCAGALAEAYESLGGAVTYAGKPHAPVYRLAFERIAELRGRPVPADRILAIGDVIRTDIAGAAAMGLDSVFIASGIHVRGTLDQRQLDSLFAEGDTARPIAALPALCW